MNVAYSWRAPGAVCELGDLETWSPGFDRCAGLAVLAVEWLVEHAGEHAFGLTPEAFYDRFEAYRAALC